MKQLRTTLSALLACATLIGVAVGVVGCSSARKKTTPELSRLHGKKVALVTVDGEATARQVVEVALVNQLVKNGTFELLSRQQIEKSRAAPEQDPTDWKGIARRAGADVALRAKVLKFETSEHEGYSKEIVEDSEMAAEQGEKARKTERVFKAKALEGEVRVELEFTDLEPATDESSPTRTAVAEATDRVEAEAKKSAIHLPARLSFLEKIANTAFRQFFEQYQ